MVVRLIVFCILISCSVSDKLIHPDLGSIDDVLDIIQQTSTGAPVQDPNLSTIDDVLDIIQRTSPTPPSDQGQESQDYGSAGDHGPDFGSSENHSSDSGGSSGEHNPNFGSGDDHSSNFGGSSEEPGPDFGSGEDNGSNPGGSSFNHSPGFGSSDINSSEFGDDHNPDYGSGYDHGPTFGPIDDIFDITHGPFSRPPQQLPQNPVGQGPISNPVVPNFPYFNQQPSIYEDQNYSTFDSYTKTVVKNFVNNINFYFTSNAFPPNIGMKNTAHPVLRAYPMFLPRIALTLTKERPQAQGDSVQVETSLKPANDRGGASSHAAEQPDSKQENDADNKHNDDDCDTAIDARKDVN